MIVNPVKSILVSQQLHEELTKKGLLNQGTSSLVYTTDDPNILIKKPKNKDVYPDHELEQFKYMQKHPEVFVKIYDIKPDQIAVQHLNTDMVKNNLQPIIDIVGREIFEYADSVAFHGYNQSNEDYSNMLSKLKKYKSFIFEFAMLFRKVGALQQSPFGSWDLGIDQFGFDKNNKLKLLDL